MEIRQKKNKRQQVEPQKLVFELYILFEKNVEVDKTEKAKKRKQDHDGFIGKPEEFNKWITHEFNERRACTVKIKPRGASEIDDNFPVVKF